MRRPRKPSAGCPEWMLTYGDMSGLLLCFFVMLASMSELRQNDRFLRVAAALRAVFNFEAQAGEVPIDLSPLNTLLEQLQAVRVPSDLWREGEATVEGVEGRDYKVTNIRDGIHLEIGGRITFERFSAVLKPGAASLVRQIADQISGKNNIIQVTGHATREPLPEGHLYRDAIDLSYARGRAVADELMRNGVRSARIRIVAAGSAAPVERDDYTAELRARNRRVEIVVTEGLVEEYAGRPFTGEFRESTDVSGAD